MGHCLHSDCFFQQPGTCSTLGFTVMKPVQSVPTLWICRPRAAAWGISPRLHAPGGYSQPVDVFLLRCDRSCPSFSKFSCIHVTFVQFGILNLPTTPHTTDIPISKLIPDCKPVMWNLELIQKRIPEWTKDSIFIPYSTLQDYCGIRIKRRKSQQNFYVFFFIFHTAYLSIFSYLELNQKITTGTPSWCVEHILKM